MYIYNIYIYIYIYIIKKKDYHYIKNNTSIKTTN